MVEPDVGSRKRRRIAPISFTTALPNENGEAGLAGLDLTLDAAPLAEHEQWDFLSKWKATDNTVIGDIEEEEFYSNVSDGFPAAMAVAEQESEEDDDLPPEGPAIRHSKLGAEKVIQIINDCIEMYANAWTPGKGETKHKDDTGQVEVPVTYDPFALWEDAESAGQREQLAEEYELEAEYYRQRLDKLCEEISKDPGDTVAGVQMKCRNLEVTVELLERATWLEDIYKLPPNPVSDGEEQDESLVTVDQTQPPTAQPTNHVQHKNLLYEIIELDSPPDSEASGDESVQIIKNQTPVQVNNGNKRQQMTPPIILAGYSAVTASVETTRPASAATSPLPVSSRALLGDAPESASISTVNRWSWAELEETQDRKRVVSKAICELRMTDREIIRQRLQKVGRANMVREVPGCLDMLLRGNKRMPGILPQDLPKIMNFTRLFLCWWLCGNYIQKEPSGLDLTELRDRLRDGSSEPSIFCDYVRTVLSTTFSHAAFSRPTQPSQAEIIEISSGDEEPLSQLPHR